MTDKLIETKTSTQPELVLKSVFQNEKGLANFIILQDCPSQSGLPILFQLITRSGSISQSNTQPSGKVILINTTSNPLFKKTYLQSVHLVPHPSIQVIDLTQLIQENKSHAQNLKFDLNTLLELVRQAIIPPLEIISTNTHKSGTCLSIFIDCVQELFRLFSPHQTFHFVKNLLNILPNPESRLIILDSPHLNLKADDDGVNEIIDPSTALRSSTLSSSHLHLRIHPTSLIDHLINDFGLTVPVQSTKQEGIHYDLRLFQLIHELAPSCDPYLISESTTDKDGPVTIPQALLIPTKSSSSSSENKNLGSCAIEWTSKNLPSSFSSRPSTSIKHHFKKSAKSQKKKPAVNLSSVQHGLEALKLNRDVSLPLSYELTPITISEIIKKRTFTLSAPVDEQIRSDAGLESIQSRLTFNLSLTDKQKADREAVELPFLPKRSQDGTVIEAPGAMYDGSFQKTDSKSSFKRTGGMVLYEPDSADDFDDEEPDDD